MPIDLATHFIDVIQKELSNKESSLLFGGLITKIINMAKVPLQYAAPLSENIWQNFYCNCCDILSYG